MLIREFLVAFKFRADSKKAKKFDKALRSLKRGAVAVGVAIVAASVAVVKLANAAGEFEMGMARIKAISRATAEDMKRLEKAALDAAFATQFSPTETADGLRNLAQAGFSVDEQLKLLQPTLDLAAGGQLSMAQASATVTAAVKAFGLNMDEAAGVADRLLKITNLTTLSAGDLQLALGNVSRGAGVTDQSLEEMLISIGLVKNTGVDASVAATSVSSSLLFMSKNVKKLEKNLGVRLTDKRTGKFRHLNDIMKDVMEGLRDKFPDAAERAAAAMKILSRFGLSAGVAIGKQTDQIARMREEMGPRGVSGTARRMAKELLNTFAGTKTLLKGTLEGMAVLIGQKLIPVLRPLVEDLKAWIITNKELLVQFGGEFAQGLKSTIKGLINFASNLWKTEGALDAIKLAVIALAGAKVLASIATFGSALALALAPIFVAALGVIAIKDYFDRKTKKMQKGGVKLSKKAAARKAELEDAGVEFGVGKPLASAAQRATIRGFGDPGTSSIKRQIENIGVARSVKGGAGTTVNVNGGINVAVEKLETTEDGEKAVKVIEKGIEDSPYFRRLSNAIAETGGG